MRLLFTATPATGPSVDGPNGSGPVASSPLRLDMLVDADPSATVRQLTETVDPMVRTVPRVDGQEVPLYVGDRRVDPSASLADAGILDGAVIGVGGPAEVKAEPPGVVEVRVVSGPDAGRVVRLDPGDYIVGDHESAVLVVDSDGHWARIRVSPDGTVTVLGTSSGQGAYLERDEVAAEAAWPQGEQLTLGGTLFEAWPNHRPDASVVPSEDGTGLDYNRPPRLHPAPTKTKFKLPTPPEPPDKPIAQLLMMILMPITMAVGGALIMNRPQMLLIGLLAPVSVLFMQLMQRRTTKARYEKQLREFEEKTERVTKDARDALVAAQRRLRDTCPDPAAVLLLSTGPRARLWERRKIDEDFTQLRVGTGSIPSEVVLTDPTKDDHRKEVTWDMRDVPVSVSVKDNGVVGVAGSGEGAQALERWLVAQLVALHSPAELQLYLLSMEGDHTRWRWTRYVPHLRADLPQLSLGRIGIDATTCARRISELLMILDGRAQAPRGAADDEPAIVVVLDGARRIRSLPGVVQLLREGPDVGIHVLCLDAEERLLPEECRAVVSITPHGMRLRRTSFDNVEDVRADVPSAAWADRLGRALAPLRDSSVGESGGSLPRSARLLDVIGLEPPNGDAIAAHWTGGGRSTVATLGVGLDGPFAVDIRRDGPHALIAGTTGSGKSELLQTLVASLAAVNRPESMSFVLVDYKGGSAFKDCVDLPHTVGMVTDLDTHLVGRALVSLGAELHRREHLLAKAGAKDIEDYLELLDRDPRMPQMPRLMLVIDEFASMARELPDFVKGLVNIAQRGRSLGIHLVLATQRPGGAVTNDIRANTNLRIALRMTDETESRDVIDAAESAHIGIDTPGRAYVRLGHASLLPFQSGRVGGRRVVAVENASDPVAHAVKWSDLALPAPVAAKESQQSGDVEATDLTALVAAVREAAEQVGARRQASPWLEALPTSLTLSTLLRGRPPEAGPGTVRPVPIGLIDVPAQQRQMPYTFDLARTGHLHIMGSGRTGRSQTLRTLAASLALGHHPGDVHMYGLDCGNGALLPLERLPHCGAVAQRTQGDRVVRLLGLLGEELDRRQKLLAAHGCADLEELRAKLSAEERPAHIVLFIDRLDAFEQAFGEYNYGALVEDVTTLMRDGAGVGLHVVATGDRLLTRTKYSSTTEDLLVLRCNDSGDYSSAGLQARTLPEEVPDGRAFRAGDALEVQIALLTKNPQGAAQGNELARIAEFVTRRPQPDGGPRPFRVDVLPDQLSLADMPRYRTRPPRPLHALIGVGGNELTAVTADLSRVPTFLVSGPPQSGRSSMLTTMAASLLEAGTELLLVTPRGSRLADLRDQRGVRAVIDAAEPRLSQLHEALGRFEADTAVVVVDDAELLLQSDLGKEFTRIARGMVGAGWGIIAAGTNEALQGGFNGWHVHLKRNRIGALLSPQSQADGEVLGLRLPKGVSSPRLTPGTAYLHLGDGRVQQVRVPMP